MKIERVLNNNAVTSRNEVGEEIIIKGKGIAFQRSAGDVIDDARIEKIFTLSTPETNRRYQELLATVPADCMEVSEEIITLIKGAITKELSDKIYITLTDHIANLLERLSLGIAFDNSLLWDVRRMYGAEYAVGLQAVALIRERFHVKVPDDEASFIALHIVNAELNVEFTDVILYTNMIDEIYAIVEEDLQFSVDKDSLEYGRFILHLRFFLERVIHGKPFSDEKNFELLTVMKKQKPKEYDCVVRIIEYVENRYPVTLTGEILYLLMHILKITE